jgi:hypothetical protein
MRGTLKEGIDAFALPHLLHHVRIVSNICYLRLPLVVARRGEIREN